MKFCRHKTLIRKYRLGVLNEKDLLDLKRHIHECEDCHQQFEEFERLRSFLKTAFHAPTVPEEAGRKILPKLSMDPSLSIHQEPSHGQSNRQKRRTTFLGASRRKTIIRTGWTLATLMSVVLVLALLSLFPRMTKPELAFAEVRENFQATRTISLNITEEVDGKPPEASRVIIKGTQRMRTEGPRGEIKIFNLAEGKILHLNPSEKNMTILDLSAQKDFFGGEMNYLEHLKDLLDGAEEYLGTRKRDEKLLSLYRVRQDDYTEMVLWVDPATSLPEFMETKTESPFLPSSKATYSDFQYDADVDDSLFTIVAPEGYETVILKATEDGGFIRPVKERDKTSHEVRYSLTDLGRFVPVKINNRGQIAGIRINAGPAFFWDPANGGTNLGTFGGASFWLNDLNNKGQIVGARMKGQESRAVGFIWDATGGVRDIGTLGGEYSSPTAVNDEGQVVGWSTNEDETQCLFIWDAKGGIRPIPGLEGINIRPVDINNSGHVAGAWSKDKGRFGEGFRWIEGGGVRTLDSLPGSSSEVPYKQNDLGHIAGIAGFDYRPIEGTGGREPSRETVFLWTAEDGMTEIAVSEGRNTQVVGMNNKGQIVWYAENPPEEYPFTTRPRELIFIWDKGSSINLNDLIDPESKWNIDAVVDINDYGQIVGRRILGDDPRGILLTPLAESATVDYETRIPVLEELDGGDRLTTVQGREDDEPDEAELFVVPTAKSSQKEDEEHTLATTMDGVSPSFLAEGLRLRAELNEGVFPEDLTDSIAWRLAKEIESATDPGMKRRLNRKRGKLLMEHHFRTRNEENDFRYFGKAVKLGDGERPICCWTPKGTNTYHVMYGDFRVEAVDPREFSIPD